MRDQPNFQSDTQTAGAESAVLLHDALAGPDAATCRLFEDCRGVITCRRGSDITAALAQAETALAEGLYLAGAFAYELGHHLEPRLAPLARDGETLFVLGVFGRCRQMTLRQADAELERRGRPVDLPPFVLQRGEGPERYAARIARLRDYILAGDIYQANFTFGLSFAWPGDPWTLFARLAAHQHVAYGAVVDLPGCRLASLSPELFFARNGSRIEARPMKGTMRRGATPAEDAALIEALRNDPKNRAENLMILDLIRNDIGRMARIGSVAVPQAFQVETYGTLHQMTSSVTGEIDPDLPLHDILRHLFPCGSVTGAPKIRAMEIIAELECGPRGFYTGAVGYVTPERDMCFNVPIRTVVLQDDGSARMGVGSGVVFDSVAQDEYAECLLKARFLEMALA